MRCGGIWVVGLALMFGSTGMCSEPEHKPGYVITIGRPDYKVLPEGAALSAALGVKPAEPCDDQVILERSQYSTNKDLWISKTVSGQPCVGASAQRHAPSQRSAATASQSSWLLAGRVSVRSGGGGAGRMALR